MKKLVLLVLTFLIGWLAWRWNATSSRGPVLVEDSKAVLSTSDQEAVPARSPVVKSQVQSQLGIRITPSLRASRYLDEVWVGELSLSPEEIGELNLCFEKCRAAVLKEFVRYAKVAKPDPGLTEVHVELPADVAAALRGQLYGRMQEILGEDRMGVFSKVANTARFESGFEHFGRCPTIYSVSGNRDSLAASSSIEIRKVFSGLSRPGESDYSLGRLEPGDFRSQYGDLADIVLGR